MHPLHDHCPSAPPRGAVVRWTCALGVVHAVVCAVGLTFLLL